MISEFFKPGGALAKGLQGYEERPEQKRMALAVGQTLLDGGSLLVEAGTGTGKSLAYLMPALNSEKRVIVSTATRSLQDQLLRKDLPVLQEIIGEPFVAVPLKGTSNYLCRRKFIAWQKQGNLLANEHWPLIEAWSQSTEVGDRAELHSVPEDADLWSELTTNSDTRLGPRCPHYENCFVTKARRKAEDADLVVVNHHLFFSDLALRQGEIGARILPDYEAVVFDEAHGLEEVMTEHFGVTISVALLDGLVRDWKSHLAKEDIITGHTSLWMPREGQRLVAQLAQCAQVFFAGIRMRMAPIALQNEGERFTLPESLIDQALKEAWFTLDTALEELYAFGQRMAEDLRDEGEDIGSEMFRALTQRCQRFRTHLAAIADRNPGQGDYVFWGQIRGKGISLHASPIGIENVLQRELLSKVQSSIFTSATLSAGGHFEHIRSRLGLDIETTEDLLVQSPFNYKEQCLLYLPREIPAPQSLDNRPERYAHIHKLLTITDGHAFILFTSYKAMNDCYHALKKLVDFPLWIQGQAPRMALVERFCATPRSVLLATNSFWEGIDVPGQALSHVLIDKLPFDVPTDPLGQARMAKLELDGYSAFEEYQLPRAAISFKQGFGRLIRHKGDRGIVSVLDPRIVTKRYGRYFLDSLPEVPRTSAIEQVRRWWENKECR